MPAESINTSRGNVPWTIIAMHLGMVSSKPRGFPQSTLLAEGSQGQSAQRKRDA